MHCVETDICMKQLQFVVSKDKEGSVLPEKSKQKQNPAWVDYHPWVHPHFAKLILINIASPQTLHLYNKKTRKELILTILIIKC